VKSALDSDLLRVIRDQVYERNEYESLKILRGEVEVVTDPEVGAANVRAFIE
jgi:hypothetical protein